MRARVLTAVAVALLALVGFAPSAAATQTFNFSGPPPGSLQISGSNLGGGDWRYHVTTWRDPGPGSNCLVTKRDASWVGDGFVTIHQVCGAGASVDTWHTYNPPCGDGFDDFVRYRVVATSNSAIVREASIDVPDC